MLKLKRILISAVSGLSIAVMIMTALPLCVFAEDAVNTEQTVQLEERPIVYAAASSGGKWIKESNGRWWYKHADGSYTKYNWEYIDGNWYFFDENGWMWTDWLLWKGEWYYLSPSNGKMVTRWNKIDGFWYYFNAPNGDMNLDSFTYDYRTYEFYQSGNHQGALMTTKINIDRQKQEKTKWCWAASSVMVGTYYTDSNRGQKSTVFSVKGSWANQGGTEAEEIAAIRFASKGTKNCVSVSRYNIVFSKLRDKIDDNHPFLMRLKWDSGGGHAVVGAGYDQHKGKVWVIDPWENTSSQYYDFKSMISGHYQMPNGKGHCAAVLVY